MKADETSVATTTPASPGLTGERWRARLGASWLLRAVIFLAPLAAAIAASLWLSPRLFVPESAAEIVAWWGILIASTSAVAWAVDRLARRLIPLALMLKMTMVFPDRAPSRYKIALTRANISELRRRVADADAGDMSAAASLILSLGKALNEHDRRTRGHGERTRAYADMLAEEMRIPEADRDKLRWAALLHDIGKLDIPADVLNKDGPLDPEELALIRRHPLMGMRVAATIVPWLGEWAGAIEHHHEWWDGTGYPRGLKGEEISLGARIVSVADAFDVMTSGRSYQAAMSPAEAREEIARMAGTQFDPAVARALMNVSIGKLRWAIGPVTWLGQIPFYLDRLGRDFLTVSTAATVTAAAVVGGIIPLPDVIADLAPRVVAQADAGNEAVDPAGPGPGEPQAPATSVPPGGAPETTLPPDTTPTTTPGTTPPTTLPGTTPPTTPPTPPGTEPPGTPPGTPPPTTPPTTPPGTPPTTTPQTPPTTSPPAPDVNPDVASTDEDASVTVDVLANDAPLLTLSAISAQPGKGSADVVAGKVLYTPDADANGADTFTYRACTSAGACAESTVAVRVNPVNDAPVANDDSGEAIGGEPVTVPVLANDIDIDGDPLTIVSVQEGSRGKATTDGTTVTYIGPRRDATTVEIIYTACDPSGACSSAVLTLVLRPGQRPPNAVDDSVRTNRAGRATINVLANDTDPDHDLDPRSVTIVSPPRHGTAVVLRSGHIHFEANSGFSGTDSFAYRVCDDTGMCDRATVTVRVPD
ncbi:MAG TPA: Ig-like domain-containing protein [Acidimicrobiia bacterium]|nr:Ig-like domain-containing protein [Acidimicrobiia bacterium]